jgi:hypothetical protein
MSVLGTENRHRDHRVAPDRNVFTLADRKKIDKRNNNCVVFLQVIFPCRPSG